MVTKDQAIALYTNQQTQTVSGYQHNDFHYTGKHKCVKHVGPKGGVTYSVTEVRRSGSTQTRKRDTQRFRIPVKYGLYESAEITNTNANEWHVSNECPLLKEGND